MATYKVIQDIEAEDKLVGPLSLRQFIYGGIAAVCAYFSFIAVSKGFAFFLAILVPPMLFTGFFAFPWGRDQPTEVWALAKIRFFLKPRRRIWDQSGGKDLVNITAPKRVEKVYTNGLSEIEVNSRLTALASTLDSRGWAIKNVNTNLFDPETASTVQDSDRLIGPSSMPQTVSSIDVSASDDMLDEANNPRAKQLDQMMAASTTSHRQQLINQLQQANPGTPLPTSPPMQVQTASPQLPQPADYWFLNKPLNVPPPTGNNAVFTNAQVVVPGSNDDTAGVVHAAEPTANEEALGETLKAQREKNQPAINYQHMKIIQPLGIPTSQTPSVAPPQQAITPPPAPPVTPATKPVTMELAGNNDLSIATLARIANKQDEVVISLHGHPS